MKLKFGLISADSHAQLDRDAFTSRMSKAKWGDRIPQVVEVKDDRSVNPVERWMVHGKIRGNYVANCPAVMERGETKCYPQRWEEVPPKVFDPLERLKALDEDGVDGEVLFPNPPVQNFSFLQGDGAFELACVRAYNDALAEWRAASDRYVPLALVPYLSGVETALAEVERAVKKGHGGIALLSEPSALAKGTYHFNDPAWYPLWGLCEALGIPIHIHESGGLATKISFPRWSGYSHNQFHSMLTVPTGAFPAESIPNLIFSGILDRFPRLKWVSAETGVGWVNYVMEGCDHEWERRRLWTEGILTRPSELFKRQIYVNFWFEKLGAEERHRISMDNIMWESDYPHTASTYPRSWKFVEETLKGVSEDLRRRLLCENAIRLYRFA
ncbi:MAG TPA: amidohydrolase family protein [Candidatus Binatia bacterium]|jgi:predicted TIM-barrel fold metal-dependent hydrolase